MHLSPGMQHPIELIEQELGMLQLEGERRAYLQYIAIAARDSDEDPAPAQRVDDSSGLRSSAQASYRVGADFDPDE